MCVYQELTKRWLTNGKPLNNNRMFFENDKLYSYGYHYVIARIDRERNIVLINNKSSPTTNRHKRIVKNVIENTAPCIKVFNVPQPLGGIDLNLQILHDNLQSAIAAANKHMIKPKMQAVETVADDFDALAAYVGKPCTPMYLDAYKDYLALKDRYTAKRSK